MDSRSYRSIIYHHASQGKKPTEIYNLLVQLYGQEAPCKATVANWCNERKWGRTDLDNRKQSGRPPDAITEAKIDAARALVAREPKISCKMAAERLNLAQGTTKILLTKHLGMQKLLARWVPHSLSGAQRAARISHASDLLAAWSHRWSRFRT